MAENVQVYKGGTAEIKYGRGLGEPTLYGPPFGRIPFDKSSPPFNAHYKGTDPPLAYAAGCPLKPGELPWQRDNLNAAPITAGSVVEMLVVPTNHWVTAVRFDVNGYDPEMAGATVKLAGLWVTPDPADPYNKFLTAPATEIDDAIAAQGVLDIPLDQPSSTILWLGALTGGGFTGNAPANPGDPITGATVSGYVQPLYVPPVFITPAGGVATRFETGALILGVEFVTLTNTTTTFPFTANDFYLTARIEGLACASFA